MILGHGIFLTNSKSSIGDGAQAVAAPTNIDWAGVQTISEDAVLGEVVGGVLSSDGSGVTFSLTDDASGKFDVSGTSIIVTGVLNFETATSHNITIRATNSGGFVDEVFAITVTDVAADSAGNIGIGAGGSGDGEIVEDGSFTNPPVATETSGTIKLSGKKAAGTLGKFLYDLGAPQAGTTYTMQYDPDFSLLALDGALAMVGFAFKSGNDFHLVGLRGDGSTGLDAYQLSGDNLWNTGVGLTENDGGPPSHGTQAGPNWVQLEIASDGSTYTFRTSSDGATWADEYTDVLPSPFATSIESVQFGPAAAFWPTDTGPFSISIFAWQTAINAAFDSTFKVSTTTLSASNKTATWAGIGGVLANSPMLVDTYFEIEVVTHAAGNITIGAAFQPVVLNLGLPHGGTAGQSYLSNGTGASPLNVTYTAGDRIGVAYRPSTAEFWFRKNGTWLGNDPTGAAAIAGNTTLAQRPMYPWVGGSASANISVQLKAKPSEFEASAPSGFSPLVPAARPANRWSETDKSANAVISQSGKVHTKVSTGVASSRMIMPARQGIGELYAIEVTGDGGATARAIGVVDRDDNLGTLLGGNGFGVGYRSGGTVVRNNSTLHTYTAWGTVGDIIMIAIKRSTNEIWFGLNGTWNGDPEAGTGEISAVSTDGTTENYMFVACGGTDAGDQYTFINWPYAAPSGFVPQNP